MLDEWIFLESAGFKNGENIISKHSESEWFKFYYSTKGFSRVNLLTPPSWLYRARIEPSQWAYHYAITVENRKLSCNLQTLFYESFILSLSCICECVLVNECSRSEKVGSYRRREKLFSSFLNFIFFAYSKKPFSLSLAGDSFDAKIERKESFDVREKMSFQPWKQAFNNLPNQFFRNAAAKNDSSGELSTFGNKMKNGDIEISPTGQPPPPPSSLSLLPHHQFELNSGEYSSSSHIETEAQVKHSQQHNGSKFSIFSQLLNLNKINAFDNLLLNASLTLDDDDLNGDKRQGMRKLMEEAIRWII